MINGPISPQNAYDQIYKILTDYIAHNTTNPKSWIDEATAARVDFTQKFAKKTLSLDELKAYVIDTLAPQFISSLKKIILSDGNSYLMRTLKEAANSWPSQEEYLTQLNHKIQDENLALRATNLAQSNRIQVLELELAELKRQMHQPALDEASRIGRQQKPLLLREQSTVSTTPPATDVQNFKAAAAIKKNPH